MRFTKPTKLRDWETEIEIKTSSKFDKWEAKGNRDRSEREEKQNKEKVTGCQGVFEKGAKAASAGHYCWTACWTDGLAGLPDTHHRKERGTRGGWGARGVRLAGGRRGRVLGIACALQR